MKILYSIIFIFFFGTINVCYAGTQLQGEVNECFELTSIVFRIAKAPEYVNNVFLEYSEDIDNYFKQYSEDELIKFVQELRSKYGISYDAVSTATAMLEIINGQVIVKKNIDIKEISTIDERWSAETFRRFVYLLNNFYVKSNFNSFYISHQELYKTATLRANELLKKINTDWFNTFLGIQNNNNPLIVISLSNGSNNYSFSIPKDKGICNGIVIGCNCDDVGLPLFPERFLTVIVHEISHFDSNRLISKSWEDVEKASEKITQFVKRNIKEKAYGTSFSIITEWLTNLFSVMYFKDNQNSIINPNSMVAFLEEKGFIWMNRSQIFMDHYVENRVCYPNIDAYMVQIIAFLNYIANNIDLVYNEYNSRIPYIVDVFPLPQSNVSSDIDIIEIRFSKSMNAELHGFKTLDIENILDIPLLGYPFWKDNYTFVIKIDKNLLKKGYEYGFKLNKSLFQSEQNYNIKEDFIYTFKVNIQ